MTKTTNFLGSLGELTCSDIRPRMDSFGKHVDYSAENFPVAVTFSESQDGQTLVALFKSILERMGRLNRESRVVDKSFLATLKKSQFISSEFILEINVSSTVMTLSKTSDGRYIGPFFDEDKFKPDPVLGACVLE